MTDEVITPEVETTETPEVAAETAETETVETPEEVAAE